MHYGWTNRRTDEPTDGRTDRPTDYLNKSAYNRVLGRHPPPIDKSEIGLPRLTRVVLSQLRSGFCSRLRSYQKFIGKSQDDLCLSCSLDAQTVAHIFDCPARPTNLAVEDLWENPREVAHYLRSLPEFSDLPPPTPQPPPQGRPPDRISPPVSPPWTPVSLPLSPNSSASLFNFSLSPLRTQSQDLRYAESDREEDES